jgi:L-fuconolactonase
MRITDSHQHFWIYNKKNQQWINDDMQIIQRSFTPNDLKIVFQDLKVDGCISVQVDQNKNETLYQIECAKSNPIIEGVVGWVDILNDQLIDDLAYYGQYKIVKGFRHILQNEPPGFMIQKKFIGGLKIIGNEGYSYDLLIYHHQMEEAIKLLNEIDTLPIVIDHIAKPCIKTKEIKDWEKYIKLMAEHENVYCKVSGMATEANWANWSKEDLIPYLDIIVAHFGMKRIMYGSDWPVCLLAVSYERWLNFLKEYFSQFSQIEQEQFFSKNCERFYKI